MEKTFNIENCLFYSEPETFQKVSVLALKLLQNLSTTFPTMNALKKVIKTFAKNNEVYVQILYVPFNDVQAWGMFYQLDGVYFIVINSEIPMNKQNVALVHEFYHFYTAVKENYTPDILRENATELNDEDKKANAFAASFLMPENLVKIFLASNDMKFIDDQIIAIKDIMDVFMVPYKTAVIRLMELQKISVDTGLKLLNKDNSIIHKLKLYNLYEENFLPSRWNFSNDKYIDLDDLEFLMVYNKENELISPQKLKKQEEIVKEIMQKLRDQNWALLS